MPRVFLAGMMLTLATELAIVPSDIVIQRGQFLDPVGTNLPTQIPMRTGSPYFLAEAVAKSKVVPMRDVRREP